MLDAPSRRAVLAQGAAAAAVLGTLPATAGELEDPVLPVYREWLAACQDYHLSSDESSEDAATVREFAAEKAITALTPTTMAGFAAVAHLLWDRFGQYEDRNDVGVGLILAIWRAAGGHGDAPPERSEM